MYPHHERLTIENLTAFRHAELEFCPGINVLIGENGTGKTHLLKWLYATQLEIHDFGRPVVPHISVFGVDENSALIRHWHEAGTLTGQWDKKGWTLNISPAIASLTPPIGSGPLSMPRPVFIPAIDMLAHTRRFLSTYDLYQIDFDWTHRDIVALLLSPERRMNGESSESLGLLATLLGGEIEEESERFYLRTSDGRLPMPLVAEGIRKVATLHQLIRNGHLQPGSTLFWDEPEANTNPKIRDEIVGALRALARNGVQIFLATHSYIILKELDLQSQAAEEVRFFALELTPEGTQVHATDDYALLRPNPIAEQFDSIYDRELTRATGRRRA